MVAASADLSDVVARFCSTLESAHANFENDQHQHDDQLARDFRSVLYEAAEWFEMMEPTTLFPQANRKLTRAYADLHKGRRRDWALACNKLKHEHHVLVPVSQLYQSGQFVLGYSLQYPKGIDTLAINANFHTPPERCRGYLASMHQMMFDIFRTDAGAASTARSLGDYGATDQVPVALRAGAGLAEIANFELLSFSDWNHHIDAMTFRSGTLEFNRTLPFRPPQAGEMAVSYAGDGITRTFEVI